MKFVFLILLSSDTVGTNIAQYIVSCFFCAFPDFAIKGDVSMSWFIFFLQQLYRGGKNLHFNFSLIFSIIEGKKTLAIFTIIS